MFNETNKLSLWPNNFNGHMFSFEKAMSNFLRLLDGYKDKLPENKLNDAEFYKTLFQKKDDGTGEIKAPFNKSTDEFVFDVDTKAKTFTLYIKSDDGIGSTSSTFVKDSIPEGYDIDDYDVNKDGGYLTITFKPECQLSDWDKNGSSYEDALQKDLEKADNRVCELDAKMEDLNEKMHEAIDEEDFDLLHVLSGEYKKTEEELKKAEEERHQIGTRLYDLKNKCGHECCHAGNFEVKSNKWKRDEKGRFVKQ